MISNGSRFALTGIHLGITKAQLTTDSIQEKDLGVDAWIWAELIIKYYFHNQKRKQDNQI